MELQGAVTLELYVATPSYPDRWQYLDSQYALLTVKHYGLKEVIELVPLDGLNKHIDLFDIIKKDLLKLKKQIEKIKEELKLKS